MINHNISCPKGHNICIKCTNNAEYCNMCINFDKLELRACFNCNKRAVFKCNCLQMFCVECKDNKKLLNYDCSWCDCKHLTVKNSTECSGRNCINRICPKCHMGMHKCSSCSNNGNSLVLHSSNLSIPTEQVICLRDNLIRIPIEEPEHKLVKKRETKNEVTPISQKKEKIDEEEDNMCKVCFEKELNSVVMDCGHVCMCFECASKPNMQKCPICREQIIKVVRTYKS